jgi:S1-C subfamily serine protease
MTVPPLPPYPPPAPSPPSTSDPFPPPAPSPPSMSDTYPGLFGPPVEEDGGEPPADPPPTVPADQPEPGRPRHQTLRAGLVGGIVGAVVAASVAVATVKLTDDSGSSSGAPVAAAPLATSSGTPTSGGSSGNSAAPTELAGPALDIHSLLAAVKDSVVDVEIGQQTRNGQIRRVAAGSGVIISNDGLVLTNAHVVQITDQFGNELPDPVITVKMADGTDREVTVLGASAKDDVALLQLKDTSNLTVAQLGSSGALQVGDEVVAIGNALDLGDSPTVTTGIVSATDRELQVDANITLSGLIQTDAAINHGNSGGGLFNAAGQLVGINSAGIPDAQNLGFAIGIDSIKPLLDTLKAGQEVPSTPVAYLGVTTQETAAGVEITDVGSDTAAEQAGLQPGDLILQVDGQDVTTADDLGAAIRAHQPGEEITVEVERSGRTTTVTATLQSRPQ